MAEYDEILDLSSDKDPENVLKMEPADAEYEMSQWYFPDFISKSDLTVSSINAIFDSDLNLFQPPSIISANEYIFFRYDSGKELSQINLQTFQETKFTLNLTENIHFQISSCILPNKSVFYYSNPSASSGYTFIIDKNKNIKQLPDSKPSPYLYQIYFNGFIYALGGRNNLAQKYCLKTNLWESCAPLPTGLDFDQTAAVLFHDEILLTGRYITKLIKYNPKIDNYNDIIGLNLTHNQGKILFKGNKKVYVLQICGNIFESGENNLSTWNSIGSNNIPFTNYPTTYLVENKGCIYMVLNRNQLYEFNLSSKQLTLVNTYN